MITTRCYARAMRELHAKQYRDDLRKFECRYCVFVAIGLLLLSTLILD